MPVDRVVDLHGNDEHRITVVEVIVECKCGDVFVGDTEGEAISGWQNHAQDETHTER